MNITRTSLFCMIIVACSCSEKVTEEPWGLTGTVKGTVRILDEFGTAEADQSGAVVSFDAANTSKKSTTDAEGKFVAEDIPMGTYDVLIEKPGFGTGVISGYKLMGGKNPAYTMTSIARKSTTKVTNFSLSFSENATYIQGNVTHNLSNSWSFVYFVVFISKNADVSPTNYDHSVVFWFDESSGASFTESINIDRSKFPSGTKIYLVAYGTNSYYYYDQSTGKNVYSGVGDIPSNAFSVVVP